MGIQRRSLIDVLICGCADAYNQSTHPECRGEKHMRNTTTQRDTQLRLIECWLPLAQEANILYGWGYDAASLERLITSAADALERATNSVEARGILWYYHARQHQLDHDP
jgi:hypothetical protein